MAKRAVSTKTNEVKTEEKQVTAAPASVPAVVKPASVPAVADDVSIFDNSGSTGLENITAKDLMIPRLTILQALSPQLQRNKPEFIPEAQVGDFCDTGTNELFRGELSILPVFYARIFLEWAPRSTGKGLVANHGVNSAILDKCKPDDRRRMVLPNGNYIAETATYFCLNLTGGLCRPSFIPLTSTQLRASRRWLTLITSEKLKRSDGTEFQPPIYYRSWKAEVVEQSNNEGSWFGWKFSPGFTILQLDPGKSLLKAAKDFHEQARDGLVQGDMSGIAEEHASEPASDAAM